MKENIAMNAPTTSVYPFSFFSFFIGKLVKLVSLTVANPVLLMASLHMVNQRFLAVLQCISA